MLHSRAGYRSARPTPSIAHIRLATHGRSIQMGQSRPVLASNPSVNARYALKAEIDEPLPIDGAALHVIQAPKSLIRYELTDYEWAAIRPMLPKKARGVPHVDDRRVLNGICWVLIRRTMARSAGLLWPMHHLFRPVAKGRSVGADHARARCRSPPQRMVQAAAPAQRIAGVEPAGWREAGC